MDQKTVLIVDDTPENLTIMSEILKPFYMVKAAPKGIVALKIAMTKPDLILLDILMPEMDGFQVCEKLKAQEETKEIPVIFISGNSGQEEVDAGMALGAVNYLFKPIEAEKLIEAVKQIIGS